MPLVTIAHSEVLRVWPWQESP